MANPVCVASRRQRAPTRAIETWLPWIASRVSAPRRYVGAIRKRIERLGLLGNLLEFACVEHRVVCAGFGSVDAHADMSGPIVTVSSLPIVRGSVSATPNAEAVPRRT
jgi:hypothetical protein